jgi:flagellar assembly protein FliH
MPAYAKCHGQDEITDLFKSSLTHILEEPRLSLKLNTNNKMMLEDDLTVIAEQSGYNGRFVILTDDELDASDLILDWGSGSIERCQDDIQTAINALMTNASEHILAGHPPKDEAILPSSPSEKNVTATEPTIDVGDHNG